MSKGSKKTLPNGGTYVGKGIGKTGGGGDVLLRPLIHSGKAFSLFAGVMIAIITWAAYAYYVQLTEGLIVTGMRDVVLWGLYVTNFVFFIGISHAGTLISAILRITGAEWRRPITRMAEAITVFALIVAAPMVIIDLGRPERMFNLIFHGRIQSPILWDLISISTYLTGCIIYLFLPMVPDLAFLRDRLKRTSSWRRRLYKTLSLGWSGSEEQKRRLEKGIAVMAVIIIPIAVSVHTVVSWIFGMTLRVGWHSTIFGPYFVVGAIFSGIASIIIAMGIFRRVYHLEDYIKPLHFQYLGLMLLALNISYIYFMISEYLTTLYTAESADIALLNSLGMGEYAPLFWGMLIIGFVLPAFILAIRRTRTVLGTVVAAILVDVAMWVKRFMIIIPSLVTPMLPYEWGQYQPTWVEWSITAGAFAVFMLLYAVFSKVFPIVSIWEVSEGIGGDKGGS
ncbi:MAG: NrfD/PsrC family molybdoenzyme membrane anchor subunit [Candidatus Geothermarchaeales archaeon]